MSIKGQLQATETNDYGYARIKVSGKFYGADKKGAIDVSVGDIVEFEAFDKPGNNGKVYATFKFPSLKKVAGATPGAKVDTGPTASKDEYWAKKEAADAAKEPRIQYMAAFERAVLFADLALRNGALTSFAKAKDTAKLEVLTAFVAETTQAIIKQSYAQTIPSATTAAPVDEAAQPEETAEDEQEWK
jgi:uridine phosphorylase